MLNVNLYDYGQSFTSGNKFLRVDRTFKNIRKIKPSLNFKKIIDDMVELGKKEMNKLLSNIAKDIEGKIGNIIDGIFDDFENTLPKPNPDPDPDPDPDNKFYFPVDYSINGINFWSPPYQSGTAQEQMEYGYDRGTHIHIGYDIG